jgi:hypothetical protein
MTPQEFETLKKQVDEIQFKLDAFVKPDRYLFTRDIELARGKKIKDFIFGGEVASDGTAVRLPEGWTSTRTAAGNYKITHNLNTAFYGALATAFAPSSPTKVADILTRNVNDFTVDISLSGGDNDSAFFFIVILT